MNKSEPSYAHRHRRQADGAGGFFASFFGPSCGLFLDHFWGHFGDHFGDQIGPRRGQDGTKRAIKSFKDAKSCICKNIKKLMFFWVFGVQRPPERALGGPRRLPRGTQRAPKSQKRDLKRTPKLLVFGLVFWAILGHLGAFWRPSWGQLGANMGNRWQGVSSSVGF